MDEYHTDMTNPVDWQIQDRDGTDRMQIIFHTGAHCTDDERLIKCLLRNKDSLTEIGSATPGPSTYRQILKESFQAMDEGVAPSEEAREILLDEILDGQDADRLIMSNMHFFGSQRRAVADNMIYPDAPYRIAQMRRLFNLDDIEVFMAVRNPASFIPGILAKANQRRIGSVLDGTDLMSLRWSDTILRMREAAPDISLTLWCNEDLPLIWGQIIREMAGIDLNQQIKGEFDLLGEIMTKEGIQRFKAYIRQKPEMNEMQRRRVIAAFLDKFANDDELEEIIDLPGWTEDLIDALTTIYDEDMFILQRIPGVQLITP